MTKSKKQDQRTGRRMEVPAKSVGLEGKTINSMAFTLYGGRATWDRAGKYGQP